MNGLREPILSNVLHSSRMMLQKPPVPSKPSQVGSKAANASFAAAKALFEAAKKPEVRNAALAASKNPIVRDVAKSAAKDPQTRQLVMEALMKQQQAQANADKPAPPPKVKSSFEKTPPVPRHGGGNLDSSYNSGASRAPTHYSSTTTNCFSSSSTSNYTSSNSATNYSSSVYPSLAKEMGAMTISTSPHSYGFASHSNSNAALPNRPAAPLPNRLQNSPTQDPYAVTLYPFQGSQFDELTCETGDKILLKREVDDQWIYGMNMRTGQHGIVPLGYLEVRIPLAPTSSASHAHSLPTNVTCALYDYLSGIDGDLQFRSGDQITVLEYVNADWLRGEIAGKRGIFPSNYVDTSSLTLSPPTQSVRSTSALQTGSETATVAFDYNSGVADDLVCRAGDVVTVVEHVNSDWIKGRLNGREGLVPTTYLQMSFTTTPTSTAKTINVEMTAISDYSSTEPGHLEMSKGDKVIVLEDVDAHWYKARLSDRAFRFLPPAFVPKNILQ